MSLLIAVKSCGVDHARGAHDLLREMWGHEVKDADLLFFTGRAGIADSDEIIVDAPDDYPGLPFKTQEIAKYARKQNYDYAFLTDTGSFVVFHHLKSYDYYTADYMGYWGLDETPFPYTAQNRERHCIQVHIPKCYPWASGGGYFLSKRAIDIVADAFPVVWAEDLNVAQVLAPHGIFLTDRSKAGYKGYIVDWIHNENNSGGLERRRMWMEGLRAKSDACIASGVCEATKVPHSRIKVTNLVDVYKMNPTPWDKRTR
jgi:hypothetical protein